MDYGGAKGTNGKKKGLSLVMGGNKTKKPYDTLSKKRRER